MGLSLVGKGELATAIDERVRMVLDVLGGREVGIVAAEHSTQPRLLEQWMAQFTSAGARALAAEEVADEATADHLLAIVADEIRSPLTSAAVALRLLANEDLDSDQREEISHAASRHLDQLSQLADDVLDGASVALGRMELKLETFDLRRLIASVANELANERLVVRPGTPLMIVGDSNRLRQVVGNVMHNALGQTDQDVDIALERHPGYATIVVINHVGEAVRKQDANGWFEPFARGSSQTGYGLGLYVVRALAAAHAGTVGVDSLPCEECEVGQDLKVWVRLPIVGPPSTPEESGRRAHPRIPAQDEKNNQ